MNEKTIDMFEERPWLDPSWPCEVRTRVEPYGPVLEFKSAQAAYQACKCPSVADKMQSLSAYDAWTLGQTAKRRGNWGNHPKYEAMKKVQLAKFSQNPDLYWGLLSLRDENNVPYPIVADCASEYGFDKPFGTWWGVSPSKYPGLDGDDTLTNPKNALGNILTDIRGLLMQRHPAMFLEQALMFIQSDETGEIVSVRRLGSKERTLVHTRRPEDGADFKDECGNPIPSIHEKFDINVEHVIRAVPVSFRDPREPGRPSAFAHMELTLL